MTRLVYTDLHLRFTPTTTTFPSSTGLAADITNFYQTAADLMKVAYSATVPDDAYISAMIKYHMEDHWNTVIWNDSHPEVAPQKVPPLMFTKDEVKHFENTTNGTKKTITCDSASKSEDIG